MKTRYLIPAIATNLKRYFVVALYHFEVVLLFEIILKKLVVFDEELLPVIFCKVIVEVVLFLSIYDYFKIKIFYYIYY